MCGLRRKASYVLAALGFGAGALAGAALGGGLPTDLITTAPVSVSVSTPTVSLPVTTAVPPPPVSTTTAVPTTVAVPTVTVPTVETPPAVTGTVAPPAVAHVVSTPRATVTTATQHVASVARAAVPAAVSTAQASVPGPRAAGSSSAPSAAAPQPSFVQAAAPAARIGSAATRAVARTARTAMPLQGLAATRRPVREAAMSPFATPWRPSAQVASTASARPATPTAAAPARTVSDGSFARRNAPAAGALAALAALAALGLAGAARSTTGVAACAELARLPFPRFRILPCPSSGAQTTAAELASAGGTTAPGGIARTAAGRSGDAGPGVLSGAPIVPSSKGVLGAATERDGAWKLLDTVLLALLLAANTLLIGVRSNIARLQRR